MIQEGLLLILAGDATQKATFKMDLKTEFDLLLENEEGFGVGKWVLLRHFTDEYSEYYDEITKEAVGGPKYKYKDNVLRAYTAESAFGMSMTADGITRVAPGDIPTQSKLYYFKSDVIIKQFDQIYVLPWVKKEKPIVVFKQEEVNLEEGKIMPSTRCEVMKTVPLRIFEHGDIDYIKVYTEEHIL